MDTYANCSECAYYKEGLPCMNESSVLYGRVVKYNDRCDNGTGRESDGFITKEANR